MEPSGFCFMHSERLGYVTSCPSNLGTAMRITGILSFLISSISYLIHFMLCFVILCRHILPNTILSCVMSSYTT